MTAKANKSEQSMAKHHLIDIVDAGSKFTVVDFRDAAVSIIDNLLEKQKIPILVGGTNYYIESVLWKVLVNPPRDDRKRKNVDSEDDSEKLLENISETSPDTCYFSDKYKGRSAMELHQLLQAVDPGSKFHSIYLSSSKFPFQIQLNVYIRMMYGKLRELLKCTKIAEKR